MGQKESKRRDTTEVQQQQQQEVQLVHNDESVRIVKDNNDLEQREKERKDEEERKLKERQEEEERQQVARRKENEEEEERKSRMEEKRLEAVLSSVGMPDDLLRFPPLLDEIVMVEHGYEYVCRIEHSVNQQIHAYGKDNSRFIVDNCAICRELLLSPCIECSKESVARTPSFFGEGHLKQFAQYQETLHDLQQDRQSRFSLLPKDILNLIVGHIELQNVHVVLACPVVQGTMQKCGHIFHFHCMMRWTTRRALCPLCNSDWKWDDKHILNGAHERATVRRRQKC